MVSIFSLLNHFEHGEIGLKLSGAKKRYGESRLEYGTCYLLHEKRVE